MRPDQIECAEERAVDAGAMCEGSRAVSAVRVQGNASRNHILEILVLQSVLQLR